MKSSELLNLVARVQKTYYDALGRKRHHDDALGRTTTWSYSQFGSIAREESRTRHESIVGQPGEGSSSTQTILRSGRQAGCSAHARRPFERYTHEDPVMCTIMMLDQFGGLQLLEEGLDTVGRNAENVAWVRETQGHEIWQVILV